VCQAAQALIAGIDRDMSNFTIERVALIEQTSQRAERIDVAQQGSVAVVARALPQIVGCCPQVNNDTVLQFQNLRICKSKNSDCRLYQKDYFRL